MTSKIMISACLILQPTTLIPWNATQIQELKAQLKVKQEELSKTQESLKFRTSE